MSAEFVSVFQFNQLVQAMTQIRDRVVALEQKILYMEANGGQAPKKSRKPTTYAMYLNVRQLHAQGVDYMGISKQLDIHPSTVKDYLNDAKWTPELIEKKKRDQYAQQPGG